MQAANAPLAGPVARAPTVALRLASDARLARLAAAGSEAAMAAIFERHHQALHRYCYSIVGDGHDAADALQNTMIKALRSLPGETRQVALRPWLYRIAHNESISLLRARRSDSDLDAAANVGDAAAAGAVDARERLRSLGEDLRELTERQRGALLMRELGGLGFEEVAAALATTEAAVKQSVYEARRALQAMEEGRAMECDSVRRTLSDGDRRALRGMRMRGHLRACAGCHDFEVAMRGRPAQLAALIPPLPAGVAASMLHGILGGGAGSGGGGVASVAGLAGGGSSGGGAFSASAAAVHATSALSLGAKVAVAVAATATVAGGTVYAAPGIIRPEPGRSATAGSKDARGPNAATGARAQLPGAGAGSRPAAASQAPARAGGATSASASGASSPASSAAATGRGSAATQAVGQAGAAAGGKPTTTGKPAATANGKPATVPGTGKPATAANRKPATARGKPATAPGKPATAPGKPATASGKPNTAPGKSATTKGKPAGAGQGRPSTPSTKPATPAAARPPKPSAPPAPPPASGHGGSGGQSGGGTQPPGSAPGAAGGTGQPVTPGPGSHTPPAHP